MTRLVMTLIASSILLVGCGSKEASGPKVDLSEMRSKCMELSGFTGNADYYPGGMFLWRADGEKVAECEWHDGPLVYLGILGHSHVSDQL